jgi:hypothetical protein
MPYVPFDATSFMLSFVDQILIALAASLPQDRPFFRSQSDLFFVSIPTCLFPHQRYLLLKMTVMLSVPNEVYRIDITSSNHATQAMRRGSVF